MISKQQKGGNTTALRAQALRAKVAVVVALVTDRQRGAPWKAIASDVARLCGVSENLVLDSEETTHAFRYVTKLHQKHAGPIYDPNVDLARYIAEADLTADIDDKIKNMSVEQALIGQALLQTVPGMRRGRKRRRT